MTNKNPILDIAKGIAIILVVYGHVIEHSMAPWGFQDFFQNPVFKVIYTFHMPLFVFISGYLMAYSLNRNSVQDVFKTRYKSLFVPFISLSVLGIIMTYVLNIIFGDNLGRVDIARDLADQLLLKPAIWFLFTLFVLSSLLAISVKLEERFGAISFVGIYFLLMIVPYNNYCALYYIKWFYLFYLAGYFVNRVLMPDTRRSSGQLPILFDMFTNKNRELSPIYLLVTLILFCWLLGYWTINDYIYINRMDFTFMRLVYRYIMGFLGIIIAFYLAAYLLKTKMASMVGRIGVYSLDIYIIQMFLLEGIYPRLMRKANIYLDFNSPLVLYIVAPLITAFFVWLCIVSSKLLIRKNPILNKLLLGGRV